MGGERTVMADMGLGYGSDSCAKKTKYQCRIIKALVNNPSLSLKEISYRTGIGSRTIFIELAELIACQIVLKDNHKLYSLNPSYGKYLIDEGLHILGYQTTPDKVRFVTLIQKLRGVVDELMACLKKVSLVMISVCSWTWRTFHSFALLLFILLMKLK